MVRIEEYAARRRGGQVKELSDVLCCPSQFFLVEPVAQMDHADCVEGGNIGGKVGQPDIGITRISFAAAEGLQFAKAGTGVGPRQQLAVRVAAGRVQERRPSAGRRKGKDRPALADRVSHVEQHPAAGAARNRRKQDDLRSRGEDFPPRCRLEVVIASAEVIVEITVLSWPTISATIIDEGETAQGRSPSVQCDLGIRASHRRRNHFRYVSDASYSILRRAAAWRSFPRAAAPRDGSPRIAAARECRSLSIRSICNAGMAARSPKRLDHRKRRP